MATRSKGQSIGIQTNSPKTQKESSQEYLCPECQFPFTRQDHLKRHLSDKCCKQDPVNESHQELEIRSYICPLCKFAFKRESHLNRHMSHRSCSWQQTATTGVKRSNPIGQMKSKDKHEIAQALEIRQHVCDICNFAFKRESHLKRHMLHRSCWQQTVGRKRNEVDQKLAQEFEIRPHICYSCNFAFKRESHLKRHISDKCCKPEAIAIERNNEFVPIAYDSEGKSEIDGHVEIRSHVCPLCHFGFKRESHLKRHIQRRACCKNKLAASTEVAQNEFHSMEPCFEIDDHHQTQTGLGNIVLKRMAMKKDKSLIKKKKM